MDLPRYSIAIHSTVASYREWRRKAFQEGKSVGFVATMGALHEGHASLVEVPSKEGTGTQKRTPDAVFVPSVKEMYPSGISQTVSEQKGTFVEVKGFGHQMEGSMRPDFFRGVATVVTKLFHVIEPSKTYFGQKDIQQALILRKLTGDLLLSHPSSENLHIVPTARDSSSSLALSSRNAYLQPIELTDIAPSLYAALQEGKRSWETGLSKSECIARAKALIESKVQDVHNDPRLEEKPVIKLDYIEMNDPESFDVLSEGIDIGVWEDEGEGDKGRPVILSGAMWVGKTRLIDNIVLGDGGRLGIIN
ncbi:hypothetical protein NLI96_g4464 [Meripilus lineatus]|uniref:Pantoate--beta-alanine ligase n=1 Tax=Meripilus lineatus TaxID=2056292 RepID=A0AAD5YJW2_9APHY|nr:hypothetical protein NLI96_g4464 [Physisporinus lineatus]